MENDLMEEYNNIIQKNKNKKNNINQQQTEKKQIETKQTEKKQTEIQQTILSPLITPFPIDRSKLFGLAQLNTPNWNRQQDITTPHTAPIHPSSSSSSSSSSSYWNINSPIHSQFQNHSLLSPIPKQQQQDHILFSPTPSDQNHSIHHRSSWEKLLVTNYELDSTTESSHHPIHSDNGSPTPQPNSSNTNLNLQNHPSSSSSIASSSSSSSHDTHPHPNSIRKHSKSIHSSIKHTNSSMNSFTGPDPKNQSDPSELASNHQHLNQSRTSLHSHHRTAHKPLPLELVHPSHHYSPLPHPPFVTSSKSSPSTHHSTSSIHSPSTIAHSILRTASSCLDSKDLPEMEIGQVAAHNDHTAEALRKLDGLSNISPSPRVARQLLKDQSASTTHQSHRRPTSTGPRRRSVASRSNSRPSSPSAPSVKDRTSVKDRSKTEDVTPLRKTRTRSVASTKDSVSNTSSSLPEDFIPQSDLPISTAIQLSSPSKSTRTSIPTQPNSSVTPSGHHLVKTLDGTSPASSPHQVFHSIGSVSSRSAHLKSTTTPGESPDTTVFSSSNNTSLISTNLPAHQSDYKRGSSSSTSYTATTTAESRSSTQGTSVSALSSSFPSHPQLHTLAPTRSSPTKGRNSVGSEGSSVFSSSGTGTEMGRLIERSNSNLISSDPADDRKIPPVPPLPKDYETFNSNNRSSHLHHQHPSHSAAQPTNLRNSSHPHLDPLQLTKTLPAEGGPLPERESFSHPPPATPHANHQSHASVTTRFLYSLANQKTSDDYTSGSLTAPNPTLPAASSTTHQNVKPSKKWSLSAALGMNKTTSSSKDSSLHEDPALQSTLSPSHSHYTLSHSDFKEGYGSGAQVRRASWLGPHNPSSPNQNHIISPHPLTTQPIALDSSFHPPPSRLQSSRDRKESSSSILTTESAHVAGFAVPTTKSSISTALSSRRTPSGIPFFSRKTSGNQSVTSSDKSSNMFTESNTSLESTLHGSVKTKASKSCSEKTETSELGGRKSMMSLNVFIRNSVHRRPTLSTSKLSPSFISHASEESKPASSSRHSLKSIPTKCSAVNPSRHNDLPSSPKKPSMNMTNNNTITGEVSDSHGPIEASSSPRKTTLSSKASNLIGRKRGKTVSLAGPSKEKLALPPPLPPLQMSAIHATTTQRVASITSSTNTLSSSTASKRRSIDYTASSSLSTRDTRVRTLKESTTSLRKALPTIDASPLRMAEELGEEEANPVFHPTTKSRQEVSKENTYAHSSNQNTSLTPNPYQAQANVSISLTPTKIPRAVFRSQKSSVSPQSKSPSSKIHSSASPKPYELPGSISESQNHSDQFDNATSHVSSNQSANLKASNNPGSLIPRSRSGASTMSKKRHSNNDLKLEANSSPTHKTALEMEENALDQKQKTAATSETSTVYIEKDSSAAARLAAARRTVAKSQEVQAARVASKRLSSQAADQTTVSEFGSSLTNIMPSSRSSRTLASKLTIPSRMSRSSTTPSLVSTSDSLGVSSRSSSSVAGLKGRGSKENIGPMVSEEEMKGDEEMAAYAARQKTKKIMSGMTPSEVAKLFEFPKPIEPTKPMTTQEALRLYKHYLSDFEKGEILGYSEIYYVGSESMKRMASESKPGQNYGYDDERGDYQIVKNDHLIYRYEILEVLGKGSFGQVLQCRDHKSGDMFAIKIIRNKRRFHHQALVEIRVLENLVNWDPEDKHCVLKMTDHFTFRGHLCIVNELLSINLYELIRNNSFNGFSTTLIRRFTMQILSSLSLLRHHRVVHCDLKPENILLKHPGKSAIKTIDFGSSCFENEKVYTYIQSRFYRSPEVILGMNYHMAIDMWSLGCIMAELYTGYPIFPGETESEQLACIMEVLGMPDKYLIDRSSRRKLFFDSTGAPRPVVNSKGRRRRVGSKTLQSVLKTDDELFIDFISKCLAWDPERRLKPDPAMRHPWILAGRSRTSNNNTPVTSQNNLSSSTSHHSSLGVGGRLTNGRFNSGASSLHISSPRRKQLQMGLTSNPSSTNTSANNPTIHSATTNSLASNISSTIESNAVGNGSTGAGRSSVSYRLRTQSTSAKPSTSKNLSTNINSNSNHLNLSYHPHLSNSNNTNVTGGPNHFGSVKNTSSNSTITSSVSSSIPIPPITHSNSNTSSNNTNNNTNANSHNLIRQSLPVRAGP